MGAVSDGVPVERAAARISPEEDEGGMLMRLRSCDVEAMERFDGPGLGGRELSLPSESYEDMVNRLPLDLDCVDFDLRI